MAIIRERDYWQAKRNIQTMEAVIPVTKTYVENAPKESERQYWEMILRIQEESLEKDKQFVPQHEGEPAKRPCDVDRPQNESTLSQWVSA